MTDGPYRGGKVHVLAAKCRTCIFRPGNLMRLEEGRVEGMVAEAKAAESTIICHATLYGQAAAGQAACRGFYDVHRTQPLQVAERLGMIEFDPVPDKKI